MFKVTVKKSGEFTDEQTEKLAEAKFLWERVMNSQQFKDRVLGFYWDRKVVTGRLWWKKVYHQRFHNFRWNYVNSKHVRLPSMDNRDIYEYIMAGEEILNAGKDGEADVTLELYVKNNSVVGYTYPSTEKQWANWKFWKTFESEEAACNLCHEWLHKLGFGHESRENGIRKYTVPYAIGYIVRDLAKQFKEDPKSWTLVNTGFQAGEQLNRGDVVYIKEGGVVFKSKGGTDVH